jgi:hypothetical protein
VPRKFNSLPSEVREFIREGGSSLFSDFVDPSDLIPDEPAPEGVSAIDWSKQNGFTSQHLTYLRGLISRLQWDSSAHAGVLAQKWNTTPLRVRQLAAEATRQLEVLQGRSSDIASETIAGRLLQLSDEAASCGQYMAAISAVSKVGDLIVDPKTRKVDISHELRALSDADLEKLYQRELSVAQRVMKQLKPGPGVVDAEFTEDPPDQRDVADDGDRATPVMEEDESDPDGDA